MPSLQDELSAKIPNAQKSNTVQGSRQVKPPVLDKRQDGDKINFFNDEGGLDVSLITDRAINWVEQFTSRDQTTELTMTQLRRFYGEVLTIEAKLKSKTSWTIVFPQVKMIKSKASYAFAGGHKSNAKIPGTFKKFLDVMVDSVNTPEDFRAFKLVFEAVIGFAAGKGIKK